jgi:hypothetical protein
MKKKPPPGATLIARLKEQRLAREADVARRKEEASGKAAPAKPVEDSEATQESTADIVPASGKEPVAKPAARTASADQTAASSSKVPSRGASQVVHAEVVIESQQEPQPQPQAQPSGRQAIVVSRKDQRDLLHREIDIEDLRPASNDYFVLTDEIRLAGRFAAVGLIAQGLRLYRIREAEIYKDHFPTFEDYCRKEHQMSATYAYRLMRMAEMAEQVARLGHSAVSGTENMPDPFEVMISLGHRHIMALLPLEAHAAQELLVKGVPVGGAGADSQFVPLVKATEKQIRAALKSITGGESKVAVRVSEKRALVSEKQLIPALSKLVEMLEDWAVWLAGNPPPELRTARMGRGPLLSRLAKRFRAASGKIADALEGGEEEH